MGAAVVALDQSGQTDPARRLLFAIGVRIRACPRSS